MTITAGLFRIPKATLCSAHCCSRWPFDFPQESQVGPLFLNMLERISSFTDTQKPSQNTSRLEKPKESPHAEGRSDLFREGLSYLAVPWAPPKKTSCREGCPSDMLRGLAIKEHVLQKELFFQKRNKNPKGLGWF